jgi:hypothetical protein
MLRRGADPCDPRQVIRGEPRADADSTTALQWIACTPDPRPRPWRAAHDRRATHTASLAPAPALALAHALAAIAGCDRGVQHYCAAVGAEVLQCTLFDSTGAQARLTGVEYVISERLFSDLPDDEKAYWHSQVHQVKAGTLVAPGLPEETEHALASRLVRTYAKAWRLWPDPRAAVPNGVPQLMMGFTGDGQLDPVLLSERDREIGVASAEKKRQRADIPASKPVDGADAWQQGRIAQVQGAVGGTGR